MKYVHQFLVTRVSLIAIGAMLTVPLPVGAEEIHGHENVSLNLSLGSHTLTNLTTGNNNIAIGPAALFKNTKGGYNTASGQGALNQNTEGHYNTASGYRALYSNTMGIHNTASGASALLKNTTGHYNTASGAHALLSNTTGNYNTAIGPAALLKNTTGHHNTASGYRALLSNTTGHHNTASGYKALFKNKGKENTAIGASALEKNNTGYWNAAVGFHALWKNTSGVNNTGLGAAALRDNTTGKWNTGLGFRAGAKNNGSGNIFIGHEAGYNNSYRNVSNKLLIANGKQSANLLISGDFATHEVNINGNLHATGNVTTSDGRLKKDIQPLTHALDAILKLQGKTYRWKEDTTFANKADIGLIAQEVEKIFPELVAENEQGYKGIAYSKLTAVLIEAIKEQQGQMTEREARFTAQITTLEKENTLLKTIMAEQMDALLARVAMLEGESLAAN